MDIKHSEVVQWLREIYGEERIPPYEKTERSINILYRLMKECKRAESQAKILAEDYTRKAAEYNAEAQQLQKWRETSKLDPNQLSPENLKSLQALAETANILDVQTPSSTNIILAMNQLEMEHMQITSELEQEKSRTAYLLEANKDLSKKLEDITIIMKQAEATWKLRQEELAKDAKWKQFTEKKCKNYEADINKLEAKLSQVGLTKDITHGNISAEWGRLQVLEEEVGRTVGSNDVEGKRSRCMDHHRSSQTSPDLQPKQNQHAAIYFGSCQLIARDWWSRKGRFEMRLKILKKMLLFFCLSVAATVGTGKKRWPIQYPCQNGFQHKNT